ncbi:uncharacterized protein SCODWIG_02200 [Saccharomycodes ludwigii]|uniref:DNA damage checkpoint protein LCD1 n=1 Tax=Saccharomycodes ludwigii TaxID=36035 RepID=A0A376B786_9ASCO|nr:uncharacterized protein SCODWIG_02200 [Saccharomycodes ludwigii]
MNNYQLNNNNLVDDDDDEDVDDLLLELDKYTDKKKKEQDAMQNKPMIQTNVQVSMPQSHYATSTDENNGDILQILPSQLIRNDELAMAKGEVAVLRDKINELTLKRENDRKNYLMEKQTLSDQNLGTINNLKQELNRLESERQFLKLRMKNHMHQSLPADSQIPSNVTTTAVITNPENVLKKRKLLENKESGSSTLVHFSSLSSPSSPSSLPTPPIRLKLNTKKFILKNSSHNDNLLLLETLWKHKIPGCCKLAMHYLDELEFKGQKIGPGFHAFALSIVSSLTLNKFIEFILDYLLQIINQIFETTPTELLPIPFMLVLVYIIIKFRPSATDSQLLLDLFKAIKNFVYQLDSVLTKPKATPSFTTNNTNFANTFNSAVANISKHGGSNNFDHRSVFRSDTTIIDSKKYLENGNWLYTVDNTDLPIRFDRYSPFSDNGNDSNTNLNTASNKQHRHNNSDTAAKGFNIMDDEYFDEGYYPTTVSVPTFQTEFIDILIVMYSFDILEAISENLYTCSININSTGNIDLTPLQEDLNYLCNKTFTISFQPIPQIIFNVCMIFSHLVKIVNNKIPQHWWSEKFTKISTFLDINIQHSLKILPPKYNIHSLSRRVGNNGNIKLIDQLFEKHVIYEPENKVPIYILSHLSRLKLQILQDIKEFLLTISANSLESDNTGISIDYMIGNVSSLLSFEYPLLLGENNHNRDEQQDRLKLVTLSIKIIYHVYLMSESYTLSIVRGSMKNTGNDNHTNEVSSTSTTDNKHFNSNKIMILSGNDRIKTELIATLSRIVFTVNNTLLSKSTKESCRSILDSLISPQEAEAIYLALSPDSYSKS